MEELGDVPNQQACLETRYIIGSIIIKGIWCDKQRIEDPTVERGVRGRHHHTPDHGIVCLGANSDRSGCGYRTSIHFTIQRVDLVQGILRSVAVLKGESLSRPLSANRKHPRPMLETHCLA